MPTQEKGTKPARPLPYQPSANLTGFANGTVKLELSNKAPFVTKASHFGVFNNLGGFPTLAQYPAAFPGQYTVAAKDTVTAAGPVGSSAGDTAYDLTVTGPNRFLRRFVGDTATAGKDLVVEASYYEGLSTATPKLKLWLSNNSDKPVTFTVTHNQYGSGAPNTVKVAAHSKEAWAAGALENSHGWYDVTVTADCDTAWSQRFTGHLETGRPSVTG
jgi:phospholipase C